MEQKQEPTVITKILDQEYSNRSPYIDAELLLELLDFFIEDLSNMVAEYVSPALDPNVAATISIKRKNSNNWLKSYLLTYIAGISCTNPIKVIEQGIKISQDKKIMQNNILNWLKKHSYGSDENKIYKNIVEIFNEPVAFYDARKIIFLIPEKFVAGRARIIIIVQKEYYFLTNCIASDEVIKKDFITNITIKELEAEVKNKTKNFKNIIYRDIYKEDGTQGPNFLFCL